jgi:hypothetical protein
VTSPFSRELVLVLDRSLPYHLALTLVLGRSSLMLVADHSHSRSPSFLIFSYFINVRFFILQMNIFITVWVLAVGILTEWVEGKVGFKDMRKFLFRNQCPQKIWVGGFGVPLPI